MPYTRKEIADIKKQISDYTNIREIVKNASGETIDIKPYETDMRHLIDTYIEVKESRKISQFDNLNLVTLIARIGIQGAILERLGTVKENRDAVGESIENNIRNKIHKEHMNDPAYYEKMSDLLSEIIADRKAKAIEYEEYLRRIEELIRKIASQTGNGMPEEIDTPGKRALYNNLNKDVHLALNLHEAILGARRDDWRGREVCEREVKRAMHGILDDEDEVNRLFPIVKAQREY